jgi:hypothetical protein
LFRGFSITEKLCSFFINNSDNNACLIPVGIDSLLKKFFNALRVNADGSNYQDNPQQD